MKKKNKDSSKALMTDTLVMDSSNSMYIEKRDKKLRALKNSNFSKLLSSLPENELLEVLQVEPELVLTLPKVSVSLWETVCLYDSSLLKEIPIELVNDQMVLNALQCNFNCHSHIFSDYDFKPVLSKKKFSQHVEDVLLDNFIDKMNGSDFTYICRHFSEDSFKKIVTKKKDILKYLMLPSINIIEYAIQKDYNNLKSAMEFNHIDENVILKLVLKTVERKPEAGQYVGFLADYRPQNGLGKGMHQKMIDEVKKRIVINEQL